MLDSGGVIDPALYRSTAAVMGKDGGIAYRYGPSPAAYGNTTSSSNLPTWGKRTDNCFVSDREGGQRPAYRSDGTNYCGTWQVGSWSDDVGGYSSNWGHVAFVPDNPSQNVGFSRSGDLLA